MLMTTLIVIFFHVKFLSIRLTFDDDLVARVCDAIEDSVLSRMGFHRLMNTPGRSEAILYEDAMSSTTGFY